MSGKHPLYQIMQRLPGTCQVCGRWPSMPVCTTCETRHAPPAPRCPTCARRLPPGSAHCGACLTQSAGGGPTYLHALVAAVDYAYPWDGLIARFKFRGEPGWAGPLATLMLRQPGGRELLGTCDVMVPVPVTASRLAERGYNQSWELIKALRRQAPDTRALALADALVRIGNAPDQHPLPREQRLRNLQGSFVTHPQHVARLRKTHVLLVDDVSTTGTTLNAAAQALLQAGAGRVSALVLARTSVH
ncbi:MAG: phosphoribosyltransferase family protein [Hydrogenophaga sp.]|uniref:ComF family protein n=1 Tax=Hydrogenophaga sp. TaxID=1904254 RepID=UPI002ABC76E0|nr:phosphoribosyltransferase family protein [Hydrogenophaga sp.]MDZ4174045.1 phosphoribosyltransferase family protein [Hydrogenophaga sp.]